MKYFKIEPSYKKSVIELTMFKRPLSDFVEGAKEGRMVFLTKELGWRWGEFMISIPDTEEEIKEFLDDIGYDSVHEWLSECFGDEQEITEETKIDSFLLPSLDEDFVDLSEDYDAQMLSSWDGCWEEWSLRQNEIQGFDIDEESIIESVKEAYEEEYESGVETLGWQFIDTFFEMHCVPIITPCQEDGSPLEE